MLSYSTYDGSTILLLLILVIATVTDIVRHRIPNLLTFTTLFAGLLLHLLFLHLPGFWEGLKGAGVGLALLLPFYLLGGMGAGDVKLMAAVGSFIGPQSALLAVALSLCAGGLFGLFLVFYRGEWKGFIQRYTIIIGQRRYLPPQQNEIASHRFPYASAIGVGTLITLGWESQLHFQRISSALTNQLQAMGVSQ